MTSRIPFPDKMCRKKIRERERERSQCQRSPEPRITSIHQVDPEREGKGILPALLGRVGNPGKLSGQNVDVDKWPCSLPRESSVDKRRFGKEKETTNRQSGTECRLLCVIQVFSSVSIEKKKSGL